MIAAVCNAAFGIRQCEVGTNAVVVDGCGDVIASFISCVMSCVIVLSFDNVCLRTK